MKPAIKSLICVLRGSTLIACLASPTYAMIAGAASRDGGTGILPLVDGSVAHRDDNLLSYTVTECYRVYRGKDHSNAAAEMVVRTLYRKDTGKTFTIVSQSGSHLLLTEVLAHLLESETLMTQPTNRGRVVLTTANYEMTANGSEEVDGKNCVRISIAPRTSSPYLFKGVIWVDAGNGDIVKLDGVTSKSASVLAGTTRVTRAYKEVDGMPMAAHATAEASSWVLGSTTIDIDYTNYQMTLRSPDTSGEHQAGSGQQ